MKAILAGVIIGVLASARMYWEIQTGVHKHPGSGWGYTVIPVLLMLFVPIYYGYVIQMWMKKKTA